MKTHEIKNLQFIFTSEIFSALMIIRLLTPIVYKSQTHFKILVNNDGSVVHALVVDGKGTKKLNQLSYKEFLSIPPYPQITTTTSITIYLTFGVIITRTKISHSSYIISMYICLHV